MYRIFPSNDKKPAAASAADLNAASAAAAGSTQGYERDPRDTRILPGDQLVIDLATCRIFRAPHPTQAPVTQGSSQTPERDTAGYIIDPANNYYQRALSFFLTVITLGNNKAEGGLQIAGPFEFRGDEGTWRYNNGYAKLIDWQKNVIHDANGKPIQVHFNSEDCGRMEQALSDQCDAICAMLSRR
jgi:hypothetical protein